MCKFHLFRIAQKLIEKDALWFLAPFSWVWGFVVFCRNVLYDSRLLATHSVGKTVVSVGNVIAGGSGKTPFVILLAAAFPEKKVAILSRGYGPIPDEPMVLQRRLQNALIFVGKDRVLLAKKAVAEGADLLILDDGFQYRRLFRDIDIVLGPKEGHYLPRGFLRDSPKRKADFYFEKLRPQVLRILCEGKEESSISGWRVGIFCGIARPDRFKKTVEELGAEIVAEWILADHEPANPEKFAKKCQMLGAQALICTEKDEVKLQGRGVLPIFYLEIGLQKPPGWEGLIAAIRENSLKKRSENR